MRVSETFYSLQGEGLTTGYPAVFVRLQACNLMCGGRGTQDDGKLRNGATWRCDTIEVWLRGNQQYKLSKVLENKIKQGANLIITGGEPLIQQNELPKFIDYVSTLNKDCFIEIETNGTIKPNAQVDKRIDQYNVSPKLKNSGEVKERRYKPKVVNFLSNKNSQFKFVVSNLTDWQEIKKDYLPHINRNQVVLMPAGENQELLEESKDIALQIAQQQCLRYTTRLHIDIWNQKTGV